MRRITKRYPGVTALDEVDFYLRSGEVHALVGENGAGKSTLIKILAGAESKDSGEVTLDGRVVEITQPRQAKDLGISVIYQDFGLVPHLSISENIMLGREPVLPGAGGFGGFIDRPALQRAAVQVMTELGLNLSPKTPVSHLSVAQKQMVEIAKAVSTQARIIVMDEPSATLTLHELDRLFDLIRTLVRQGVSVVYISHRLEEVFTIADRVTVLRDGKIAAVKPICQTNREDLIRNMVGREMVGDYPKRVASLGETVLAVENVVRRGVLHGISFTLRKGEILGVTGLVGAGRTELARAVFGADRIDSGAVMLEGKKLSLSSPKDAIARGISLATEDRKEQGLVLGMTVRENTTLANLQAVSKGAFVDRARESEAALGFVRKLAIKTPGIEQRARNLSGGNQQKVVLAKWLFANSKVVIFDEPTRGIDVGAKQEIYQLMRRLAADGIGIIMISSELPEVIGMSDRVLVMHEGSIAAEIPADQADGEMIMRYATGGSEAS
ncbi:MAG: sugar ABC transporter ATP-binding protein [Firmicutes bacterium]|nr:sugar ABC transporter ATP-binding protein [Bacillota bacterium]